VPALIFPPHLRRHHTLAIGPNRGSCGTAAFTKQRVIIPDISKDPRWPDKARDLALNHGFCAAGPNRSFRVTARFLAPSACPMRSRGFQTIVILN